MTEELIRDVPPPPLPRGWKAVESRSRPGETVFLNEWTRERIEWVPQHPASDIPDASPDLKGPNGRVSRFVLHDDVGRALPAGWVSVASHSVEGEWVYKNVHTGERIAWRPVHPAAREDDKSPDLRRGPRRPPQRVTVVVDNKRDAGAAARLRGGDGGEAAAAALTPQQRELVDRMKLVAGCDVGTIERIYEDRAALQVIEQVYDDRAALEGVGFRRGTNF